jgi:hypothetical protein
LSPPPPVVVHHPAMMPTVPCVSRFCIAFFRPPEPFDHPRKAPAFGREMRLCCALPPCRIQEHPVPTVVRHPQGCQLPPPLCLFLGEPPSPPSPSGRLMKCSTPLLMTSVTLSANASVDSPFFIWPRANLHQGPRKHLPKTPFQHKKDWLVGWQYCGRVGRSDMRFPDAMRISGMLT